MTSVSKVQRPGSKAGSQRSSGIVVPRRLKWRHHFAAWLAYAGIRLFSATWRRQCTGDTGVMVAGRGPVIFSVWHNRLAISMTAWQWWQQRTDLDSKLVALISASRDGGILSRVLGLFGIEAVRGSSSRRGPQALLELTSWTERGYCVAITPDGPRGPRYVVQDGIIALAQLSGLPIVPVAARIRGKLMARSWDRFQIPLPFAKCEIFFGQEIRVPRDLSDDERAAFTRELQERMIAVTED